ncbi:MAG: hypothetical protein GDA49_04470 [Rhodospirillales bacterium]|nr:hypothetical protein [Rhodospirillales bacterium]
MARLSAFRSRYDDVDIRLFTRDGNAPAMADRADIVILFGRAGLPSSRSVEVFPEELIAACGPSYRAKGPMIVPADLLDENLLRLRNQSYARDWDVWFDDVGLDVPSIERGDEFNSFIVYQQAAMDGAGIALTWRFMTEDLIREGRLRQVTPHGVRTTSRCHACLMPKAFDHEGANASLAWLGAQGSPEA